MNLLVKKIGLVLLPALFFACEEPTELGTTLNPNAGSLSTHYVEIPVTTAQVRSDSVLTSVYGSIGAGNTVIWSNPYIGRVSNDDLGTLKASLYANMALPAGTISIGSNTRIDSVKFQLVWNHRMVYGQLLEAPQRFDLYQLLQPISPTSRTAANDSVDILNYSYYAGDKEEVGQLLGQVELSLEGISDKLDSA
ncbi:MAG: DUF4270 family protein, partial [Bacteroidetes bacterium]|nr:DUF4270 family protein [Bacteroidota bacterium]